MWPILVVTLVALVPTAILAAMIVFGTRPTPAPLTLIGDPFRDADFSDLLQPTQIRARDGTPLAVRIYHSPGAAAEAARVAIAIHGSSATGSSLHLLARAMRDAGITVYVPDMRGHGGSGRRGDIDCATQLDDDLADVVASAHAAYPKANLTLVGFSSGGGFALHTAALPLGQQFARAVLISPMLGHRAPTARSVGTPWAQPFLPRIIALVILGRLGIHVFDGLPALAFAIVPENAGRQTGIYSFRLMQGFGTRDYAADLRNARCPLAVLVGGGDKLFTSELFAPTVHAERPDVPVTVVPELGHVEMTTDARAFAPIIAAVKGEQS